MGESIHSEHAENPRLVLDISAGLAWIQDHRLFRAEHHDFCRSLLATCLARMDVLACEIDFPNETWGILFDPSAHTRESMAEAIRCCLVAATKERNAPHSRTRLGPVRDRGSSSRAGSPGFYLSGFRNGAGYTDWEVSPGRANRLRLVCKSLAGKPVLTYQVSRILGQLPGIRRSRSGLAGGSVILECEPGRTTFWDLTLAAQVTLRYLTERPEAEHVASISGIGRPDWESSLPMSRSVRLWYSSLAFGSLVLGLSGIVIPGIPTSFFLPLSACFMVRCSPSTISTLGRSPWIGPMIRKVAGTELPGIDRAEVARILTVAMFFGTVMLTLEPPLWILVVAEMSLLGLLNIRKLGDLFREDLQIVESVNAEPAMD